MKGERSTSSALEEGDETDPLNLFYREASSEHEIEIDGTRYTLNVERHQKDDGIVYKLLLSLRGSSRIEYNIGFRDLRGYGSSFYPRVDKQKPGQICGCTSNDPRIRAR
jgi:hypothetical protein